MTGVEYDAIAVFNILYKLARPEGKRLTNMQAQKLVYIAHGFSLAMLDEPLFIDKVQAWQFGPVIPDLYDELRKYGAGEITGRSLSRTRHIKPDTPKMMVIRAVWNSYGRFSGPELSSMTHQAGTPWSQTYTPGKRREIPNPRIKEYYSQYFKGRNPVEATEYAAQQESIFVQPDDPLVAAEIATYEDDRRKLALKSVRRVEPIDCSLETRWIAEHGHEYAGEWVALDGNRLIAHGTNAREVYEAARKAGAELPLVVKIDPPDQLPFGGW